MADAHTSIITLFEDVTKDLSDVLDFGYGSGDDFNTRTNQKYPVVWVDPITGGFNTVNSIVGDTINWQVSVNFVDLDKKTGNEAETAKVWSSMFDLMEKWVHKLDREFLNQDTDDTQAETRIKSGSAEIQNPQFVNRRKITKDLATGWRLTFTFITQSNFDYCSIYE